MNKNSYQSEYKENVSQHNSIYWKDEKYLGLGPSAHSYDGNSRQWNVSNLTKYIQLVNADCRLGLSTRTWDVIMKKRFCR